MEIVSDSDNSMNFIMRLFLNFKYTEHVFFCESALMVQSIEIIFLPLTQHEQDSLHLSLLGSRVELARVEPQFLPPGKTKTRFPMWSKIG